MSIHRLLSFSCFAIICLGLTIVLADPSPALADDCRPCPHSCSSVGASKPPCKDYKNNQGQCCVSGANYSGKGVTCNTSRRCTDQERRNRGCKDYKNSKGESCIEFAR